MDVLVETKAVLVNAGYDCVITKENTEQVYFEDECVLGFVNIFPKLSDIISNWEQVQDNFLKKAASQLKNEPQKAWNVYSVFLTSDEGKKDQIQYIHRIEEDFRGTRKIVGYNLQTREDLKRVLLPLLPIQNKIVLEQEDYLERLRKEIEESSILDINDPKLILRRILETE